MSLNFTKVLPVTNCETRKTGENSGILTAMATTSAALSPTQRRVLAALKRKGEATADELAEALQISSSAVRQHLGALRSAGFIVPRRERGQNGRPADRYHATEQTEALFASDEVSLATDLLTHVEQEDPDLVGRLFQRRRQQLVDNLAEELAGRSVEERVSALTTELDSRGYLADFERLADDRFRINLHSCAIWDVASHYRQACTAELDFLRDLLPDATVERVTHKTDGAHTCAYEINVLG